MTDSHDEDKSTAEVFGERLGKFTATHKKKILFWFVCVLVWVLGFFISLDWWTHNALPPSILEVVAAGALATIILLCFFTLMGFVYLIAAGFGKGPLKPKNGEPTIDPTWVDSAWGVRKSDAPADVSVRSNENEWLYPLGAFITGFITFVSSWIYCIATYGYLFGVGLGWLPSMIVAFIVGALWPLILIGLIGIVLLFLFNK